MPVTVLYCGLCGMPAEYCEFGAGAAECKAWWKAQHPAVYEHVYGAADEAAKALAAVTLEGANADGEGGAAAAAGDDAKKTKRGGKGPKEPKAKERPHIQIQRTNRGGRKYLTVVVGLDAHDVDLKKATKQFANKFACGCSVAKNVIGINELVIQGDVVDDLVDYIQETWPTITDDDIEVLEAEKRKGPK